MCKILSIDILNPDEEAKVKEVLGQWNVNEGNLEKYKAKLKQNDQMNLSRGSMIRSTVSAYSFKNMNERGSRAGSIAGARSSVIPSYELTKEELRSKTIDRENELKQKVLDKINPSIGMSSFNSAREVPCKIDFMKIIISLVKKEKLNIRMPETLVSGFAPNIIY